MSIFDVVAESVSEVIFNFGIPLGAFLVNVDFPAYTTGVRAFVGGTVEGIIKNGNS